MPGTGKALYRHQLDDEQIAERDAMRTMWDEWEDGRQVVFTIADVWCEQPKAWAETRAERIGRWEAMGHLDPACQGCRKFYDHPTLTPFAPQHQALPTCGSGGRLHCTCPRCWG